VRAVLLAPAVIAIALGLPVLVNWRGTASATAKRFQSHGSGNPLNRSAVAWQLVGGFLVLFGIGWTVQVLTGVTHL
jgi:hypothetical protein